jgi:hypothetical protein
MTRTGRGRLLAGLSRVVARTEDPERIKTEFDYINGFLPGWGTCRGTNKCDRYGDPEGARLCRFRSVRYALITAFMYEQGELGAICVSGSLR